jgi:sodium transport system permease protein
MHPRPILTIAKKELREIVRDRRTLILMVGLPVIVYPLMMIGLTKIQRSRTDATEARQSIVAVWGTLPQELDGALRANGSLTLRSALGLPGPLDRGLREGRVRPPPVAPAEREQGRRRDRDRASRGEGEAGHPVLAAARTAVASRRADAVLVAWPGLEDAISEGRLGRLSIYFDSVSDDSRSARDRLDEALAGYRRQLLERRESSRQLPRGFVAGLDVLGHDVALPARQAGRVLGAFLPFLLISLSLFGGFYPAVDLTAGEKERGTLQTLLCAPLWPHEIVLGKFLAVWAVSLTTAFINVTSLALAVARVLRSSDLAVPVSAYFLTAGMLFPVTLTTAALFIAVAVFARDFKDGQNFLTPVYFMLILPAGATMLPGVELNRWTAFVPIVNIALLVKALLVGEWRTNLVFLTLLSSAAFGALAMLLSVRVFEREQVLLGGRDSVRGLFGLERRGGGLPTPTLSVVTFAIVLVGAFYGSLLLEGRSLLASLLVVQYGFFLLPALAVVLGLGFSPRPTFLLRRPPLGGVVAAALLGASAWTVITLIVFNVAPPPDSLVKAMERLLMLGDRPMPLWMALLAVALTPAICEEVFFRGLVMNGLRSLGMAPAIGISALLFAAAHASVYRLLPTLLLGIVLGYVAWKTGSILASMIVHALNNGIIAAMTQSQELVAWLGIGSTTVPTWLTVGGAAATLIGLWLLWRLPHPATENAPPVTVRSQRR